MDISLLLWPSHRLRSVLIIFGDWKSFGASRLGAISPRSHILGARSLNREFDSGHLAPRLSHMIRNLLPIAFWNKY